MKITSDTNYERREWLDAEDITEILQEFSMPLPEKQWFLSFEEVDREEETYEGWQIAA